jgi:ubiquinone/menaquinone biosynthesis C-methylase UbiE
MHEVTGEQIKSCCAAAYGSDWAHLLIGDSMHPGGVELTERMGDLLELNDGSRVLDVAAGRGASGLALARRFGCHITGIDLSPACVEAARHEASRSEIANQVRFDIGDAEALGFDGGEFDAAICECALCIFPDKLKAAREMFRVLKPRGRLGLSDLVRREELPAELETLAGWVACIADAGAESDSIDCLETAGFRLQDFELHDDALKDLLQRIRGRLFAAAVLARIRAIDIPAADMDQATEIARAAESAARGGSLGYVLMTAVKESGVFTSP